MELLGRVPLATSCLLLLGPAVHAATSPKDLEARQARIEARIAAKLARLERLDQPTSRPAPRGLAAPSLADGGPEGGTNSETVAVNCSSGKSVSKAIAKSKARYLRVEVSDTCRETVVVERSGVTISGTAAGGATIDPPEGADGVPEGPAIYALGAHELALEDLTLTGGLNGLEAIASRKMRLTGVRALSNPGRTEFVDGYGVKLDASEAAVTGSELSANGSAMLGTGGPIIAINASQAEVTGTTMADNPWDGPFAVYNSSLVITASTIANNGLGPQALFNSRTRVIGGTVTDNDGDFAIYNSILQYFDTTIRAPGWSEASYGSHLHYFRSSIQAPLIVMSRSSSLEFAGSNASGLCLDPECTATDVLTVAVLDHSHAYVRPASLGQLPSNIRGEVLLNRFSDAYIETGEPITSSVQCVFHSRAIADPPPAGGVWGCEQAQRPGRGPFTEDLP